MISRPICVGSRRYKPWDFHMSTTLQGFYFKARASTTCQRRYKVITIIIHTRVSSKCHYVIQVVGSMTFARASWSSSGIPSLHGLLHQARGFMSFFSHLSRARGPLWSRYIKTSHVGPLQVHVGINDNFITNIPLCHWWQQLMLPLWACSPFVCISPFVFISPPLVSMEKGVQGWMFLK